MGKSFSWQYRVFPSCFRQENATHQHESNIPRAVLCCVTSSVLTLPDLHVGLEPEVTFCHEPHNPHVRFGCQEHGHRSGCLVQLNHYETKTRFIPPKRQKHGERDGISMSAVSQELTMDNHGPEEAGGGDVESGRTRHPSVSPGKSSVSCSPWGQLRISVDIV